MKKAYVDPLSMRAQLSAELAELDLAGVAQITRVRLSEMVHDGQLSEYLAREVITSLKGMAEDVAGMRSMPASELTRRLEAYSDTGNLAAQLLAERHAVEGRLHGQWHMERAAMLMLSMYGALALASREANTDIDNQEYQA